VNDFAIYGRLDGRSDGDKGSTNRILLQFAAGLLARGGRRTRRDACHLRKSPHDEHNHVAEENRSDKNDDQPKYVSEQFYFFFPFFVAGASGFLYSVAI
jgi:hypothetical protein